MKIFYHPRFQKSYIGLSENIKKKTERRELIFRKNLFDPRLDTHKLLSKKHPTDFGLVLHFFKDFASILSTCGNKNYQ